MRHPRWAMVLVTLVLVGVPSGGQANFFRGIGRAVSGAARAVSGFVGDLGRGAGSVLGAPLGGFVAAAATPTMESGEGAAQSLLKEADARVSAQVRNTADLADALVARNIDRANTSMAARITQVEDVGSVLIDHALGGVDEVARKRIAQIDQVAEKNIRLVNQSTAERLSQVNDILRARQTQLSQMVSTSLAQANSAVAERMAQADEIAGKRLGNVDVMLTRQNLNVQTGIVRVATMLAAVLLAMFVLWRLLREVEDAGKEWDQNSDTLGKKKARHQLVEASWRVGVQAVAGAVCLGGMFYLSTWLTNRTEREAQRLVLAHSTGLDQALNVMDMVQVRYHAAQLAILDAEDSSLYLEKQRKAQLFQDVFMRSGNLFEGATLHGVLQDVLEADGALRKARDGVPDPDVEVMEAFILWQVGHSRDAELVAARLCAHALETHHKEKDNPRTGPFLTRALARNYLQLFLDAPFEPSTDAETSELERGMDVPTYTTAQLAAELGKDASPDGFAPLQHALEYDHLVRRLDAESTPAYLQMLRAHADVVKASVANKAADVQAAQQQRTEAAQTVLAAWRRFDEGLRTNPWLLGTRAGLAAFTLNDAVLVHALWFLDERATLRLPPLLGRPAEDQRTPVELPPQFRAAAPTVKQRVRLAPMRVAWGTRLADTLESDSQAMQLVNFEESLRYAAFENQLGTFAAHAVALWARVVPDVSVAAAEAARSAALLCLYDRGDKPGAPRTFVADGLAWVVGPPAPELARQLEDSRRARRLRYL